MKAICLTVAIALSLGLVGCDKLGWESGFKGFSLPEIKNVRFDDSRKTLAEVAPPDLISQLNKTLEKYQPQVAIVSPRANATVQDTTVEVSLTVRDYPLFKDDRLALGPHLNLILDNEPYGEIYDLREPIIIKDLKPGTHTLRVLAEKPWHESFKNKEAFAQTTFNVLTETQENHPNSELPLLTYNQPTALYTAEPIMLDFYLKGVTQDDWQVRAKINGESFTIDEWQPFYLRGFQEGNNLIELELLDGDGRVIENAFNKTIRLITYSAASTENNTLAQLVKNQIPFAEAVAIAEPNYYIQPVGEPEEVETITEDLSLEAPSKEEISKPSVEAPSKEDIISEPSVEDNTFETVEEKITEDLEIEAKEETIEKIEETPVVKTETEITASETTIDPQESARQDIPAKYFSNDDNIATTSTIEETTLPPQDKIEIREKVTTIPLTEEISIVETDDKAIANTEKPDTIVIKIPKPKLKVPQWWKNLIANFQERFNVNQ